MALEVVWCNPEPPARVTTRIELSVLERDVSIYTVKGPDSETFFELIAGGNTVSQSDHTGKELLQLCQPTF